MPAKHTTHPENDEKRLAARCRDAAGGPRQTLPTARCAVQLYPNRVALVTRIPGGTNDQVDRSFYFARDVWYHGYVKTL